MTQRSIDSGLPRRRRYLLPIGLGVMLLAGLIILSIGLGDSRNRRHSRANLLAIRNVLWAYIVDNQNQAPEFGADWQQRLQASPYFLDEAFFHSPTAAPGTVSYFHVIASNGGIPAIVLLENNELNPDRGAWTVDLNGVVRWIDAPEYEAVRQSPGYLFVPAHAKSD